MPSGDNLRDLLEIARREMSDVQPEVWERLAGLASMHFPATRLYVSAQRKRRHLETMAAADEAQGTEQLSELLGLSVRRVQQLRKLRFRNESERVNERAKTRE